MITQAWEVSLLQGKKRRGRTPIEGVDCQATTKEWFDDRASAERSNRDCWGRTIPGNHTFK